MFWLIGERRCGACVHGPRPSEMRRWLGKARLNWHFHALYVPPSVILALSVAVDLYWNLLCALKPVCNSQWFSCDNFDTEFLYWSFILECSVFLTWFLYTFTSVWCSIVVLLLALLCILYWYPIVASIFLVLLYRPIFYAKCSLTVG